MTGPCQHGHESISMPFLGQVQDTGLTLTSLVMTLPHRSAVILLGPLATGSVRHRALMFKMLADSLGIKCQLKKGPAAGGADDCAVNIVQVGQLVSINCLSSSPATPASAG
jgi:hypothetical protein